MGKFNKRVAAPSLLGIILLMLAIPSIFAYDYYIFLRWVIMGLSLYLAWYFYDRGNQIVFVLFGIAALVFNPIIPLYLSKELWVMIDIATLTLFVTSLFINIEEQQDEMPKM